MLYLLYAALAGLSTIASGLLPLHPRLVNTGGRYMIAFASGVVVATALFEMIPEADAQKNWAFLGLGFFLFYLAERVVMVHTSGEDEYVAESIGWVSLAGISADNLIDGVAIAVSYLSDPMLGLFVAMAVVVHEIPQGLTTTVIMKASGYPLSKILLTLFVGAILYPIGALLSSLLPSAIYEQTVAFVAGEFIYIGAGELLPEAHRRFNIKVILSVILGSILISILELAL